MKTPWLHAIGKDDQSKDLALVQLKEFNNALKTALEHRDWTAVCRIDRLSAQIVNNIGPNDCSVIAEVIGQLLAIRNLYKQSLILIEKELAELSNQAY